MTETITSNRICNEHKQKFKDHIFELEKKIFEESEKTFKYLVEEAIKINKKSSLGVSESYLKKQLYNFLDIKNLFIFNNVNTQIQITDIECSKILRLQEEEKENKIDDYIKKIIKESIEQYKADLKKEIEKILELFKYNIDKEKTSKKKEKHIILREIENINLNEKLELINNKMILEEKSNSIDMVIKEIEYLKSMKAR